MSGKKRVLKMEWTEMADRDLGLFAARITRQSHFGAKFSKQDQPDRFHARNKIVIGSVPLNPKYAKKESNHSLIDFCVPSMKQAIPTGIFLVPTHEFDRLNAAVLEYNLTDGRGYEAVEEREKKEREKKDQEEQETQVKKVFAKMQQNEKTSIPCVSGPSAIGCFACPFTTDYNHPPDCALAKKFVQIVIDNKTESDKVAALEKQLAAEKVDREENLEKICEAHAQQIASEIVSEKADALIKELEQRVEIWSSQLSYKYDRGCAEAYQLSSILVKRAFGK